MKNILIAKVLENIEKKLAKYQNKWKNEMIENAAKMKTNNNKPIETNRNYVEEIIKQI